MQSFAWLSVFGFVGLAAVANCSSSNHSVFSSGKPSATSVGGSGGFGGASSASGLDFGGASASSGSCSVSCASDFHDVIDCNGDVVESCAGTNGCDPKLSQCANACQVAVDNKLSVGCDYYATYMDAFGGNCFAAFVANTWDVPAHLQVEFQGQQLPLGAIAYLPNGSGPSLTYTPLDSAKGLAPGEVAILFLAGSQGQNSSGEGFCPVPPLVPTLAARTIGTAIGNSFHIRSDVPVISYEINPFGGGSVAVTGASLLLPTSVWGTNYLAVNAHEDNQVATPSLNIVAAENATLVTLLPVNPVQGGNGIPSGPANVPLTFTLNKGQQAQISQKLFLTGSILQSDKPVGLMAGHVCSQVPQGVAYCDHAEQMVPPVTALGSEYAGVMYRPRVNEPAIWRLVGVVDGTQLTWSTAVGGPSSLVIGQVVEFSSAVPFVVKSQGADHPFILFQHMSGSQWMGGALDGYGDSDAVLSVPVQQYLRSYLFFADPTYPETNLVITRSPDKNGVFADVTLDCAGKLGGWQKVGDLEWTRIDLITGNFQPVGNCSTGSHEIKSENPFGLLVWGWGTPNTLSFTENVSYGYPGGMGVTPINSVVIVPNPK